MAPERVEPAERLLNLVIALAATPRRLTKEQIRSTVVGYGTAPSAEAFERMFERDKDDLRALGVPIITETDPIFEDEMGYRIDTEAYALDPIDFTAEELAVLTIASGMWRDSALSGPGAQGIMKLRALGVDVDMDAIGDFVPSAGDPGGPFGALLDAIETRRAVRFNYRAASSGVESRRVVEPWRLVSSQGGWYLIGHDREREATRVFRLSRFTSKVITAGKAQAFTIPKNLDIRSIFGDQVFDTPATALLAIRQNRGHSLRDSLRATLQDTIDIAGEVYDLVTVKYHDEQRFVSEITGFAEDVLVVEPAPIREAVMGGLRKIGHLARSGGGK